MFKILHYFYVSLWIPIEKNLKLTLCICEIQSMKSVTLLNQNADFMLIWF